MVLGLLIQTTCESHIYWNSINALTKQIRKSINSKIFSGGAANISDPSKLFDIFN